MPQVRIWAAVLGAVVMGISGVLPAEAQQSDAAYRLSEIVVSEKSESQVEAAGTVHRISAKELKDQGAKTLDDALQLIPGVYIRLGGEGTPRVDIRGFRTRHVQLFLDGVPIRETYDDQFDPTTIPVDYIAEIKVTTGGGSVLYGQGGNGGAIDIITKKGSQGVHGTVAAEAAESERYITRASVSAANEKFNAFASFSDYNRSYFELSDNYEETAEQDGDHRDNSDLWRRNLFANMGYAISDQSQLGITFNYLEGDNGKPPVANYDKTDPFTKSPKYERVDDLEGAFVQTAFSHDPEGPLSFRVWGYLNYLSQEENRYDDDSYSTQDLKGAYGQRSDTNIAGLNAQVKYQAGPGGVATLGLSAENDDWQSDGFTVVDKKGTRVAFDESRDLQLYSMAFEYEQIFMDRIGIVLGYGQHFMERDQGDSDDDYSYLVGAHFDVTDTTRLKLSHARKVRFPSIRQLYDADAGNTDLSAETTWHYEAGIEQALPANSKLQLTGFYIDAEDFIEKDETDVYRNYEKYRFYGFEAAAETRFIDNLMLRISYAWLDTEDESDNAERDELQYRPKHQLTLEGRYGFDFGLTAYASVRYVAEQYFYDSDGVAPLEKQKLDNFTLVNLKLSQKIGKTGAEVYVGAENLFDEDYEESYGLPQPGCTLYAGVEFRF